MKTNIEEVANDTNTDFYSKLFTNRKTDRTNRTILNQKIFNKICTTDLFKIESIKILINILKLGMFPVSPNIKDIFYFALIFPGHTKYLHFTRKGPIYQLLTMPNGYVNVIQVFNKLLKPPFASLHKIGCESSVYVDVSLFLGEIFEERLGNVLSAISLLQELGFSIHPTKSIFVPTQKINFLALEIDTLNITLTLNKKYIDAALQLKLS